MAWVGTHAREIRDISASYTAYRHSLRKIRHLCPVGHAPGCLFQDVVRRGLPTWAVNTGNAKGFPEPLHEPFVLDPKTGMPSDEDCTKFVWSDYYPTEATSVASSFKNFSNVIGYEHINEPWAGDIYANPLLVVPNVGDRMILGPVYEVLSNAIRQQDDEHCIFFEGVTWDDFGVGFNSVPGGVEYRNRSILSHHYYIPPSRTSSRTSRHGKRIWRGYDVVEYGVSHYFGKD